MAEITKYAELNCCGLRELSDLSRNAHPENAMLDIAAEMYGDLQPRGKNPYVKPRGIPWQTEGDGWLGDRRFFMRADGVKVYEWQAEDWRDSRYDDDDDYDANWRYAVFTQAGKRESYGKKFAALIKKEKLGEVVQATTRTVINPNSGNVLKAWLWTVNHRNLKAWVRKQKSKGAK